MTLSPQSQVLYQILLKSKKSLTARELALRLNIFPSTLYRLTEPLMAMGLITKTANYPYKYTAKPVGEGLSLFLLNQNDWFSHKFSKFDDKKKETPQSQIKLSFVQSRDELMRLSIVEVNKATKSINLLRSGHEIPAELMLAIVEARRRNVVTRMLIQDYSSDNAEQVANWRKNGILVKKTELRHVRLMIYDSSVVYFMSYKHVDSGKDMGMKIDYPPFAVILSKLFEEWWKNAEETFNFL